MILPTRVLHLHLKKEYFEQIQRGEKKEEYRLLSKWQKQLNSSRTYEEIHLHLGYPKRGSTGRTIYRKWNGCRIDKINRPLFGDKAVEVYAIDVSVMLDEPQ